MNQKLTIDQGRLLLGSGAESILVLSNLLAYKSKADAEDALANKLVNYVTRIAIDLYFGGSTTTKPISEFIKGFSSAGIAYKQRANELVGGASWLGERVELFETKHEAASYDKLNTGIYDKNSLRTTLEVNHNTNLGSKFTVFENEYE
jgi:hypothetical protein